MFMFNPVLSEGPKIHSWLTAFSLGFFGFSETLDNITYHKWEPLET